MNKYKDRLYDKCNSKDSLKPENISSVSAHLMFIAGYSDILSPQDEEGINIQDIRQIFKEKILPKIGAIAEKTQYDGRKTK